MRDGPIERDRPTEGEALLPPVADNATMIKRARQHGGIGGAIIAGAMIAMRDILEGPPKEPSAVVVDAASEPGDIDADGISVKVASTLVVSPPLPPLPVRTPAPRRRRRRHNRA